LQNSATK